jgi:hypothetical protein
VVRRVRYTGNLLPPDNPKPAYAEYEELRKEAEATCPRFVDPADIRPQQEMRLRRGFDWCTAVLGRANGPLSVVDAHMLKLADERDLNPPMPEAIVAARKERQEREAAEAQRLQALRDQDRAKWKAALAACDVPVTVRANINGRRRRGGYSDGPLRHTVPTIDAVSGRSRAHCAGRALCESEKRPAPLRLAEPAEEGEEAYATCARCLAYMPKIRAMTPAGQGDPAGERK